MRWKLGLILVTLALGMAACGSSVTSLEALPTLAPTREAQPEPTPEVVGAEALSAGRLAYVGADGNLYVLDADSDEALAVTDDAFPLAGGQDRTYHSPSWSPGGWLSYVETERGFASSPVHTVYAVRPGDAPRELYSVEVRTYVYGYWSPAGCDEGADCGRFAFLMNGESGGLELHMAQVRSDDEAVQESVLGTGAPFYYSWAPDGQRMLWLRGGSMLEIVDVSDVEQATLLPDAPGVFQAPWWSPVDDRLLFASEGSEGNHLVIADGEARDDLTGEGGQLTALSWSPDGEKVAYAEGFAPEAWPFPHLTVLSDDGEEEVALAEEGQIVCFFWSPDSRKVAFVTVEQIPGTEQAGGRVSGSAAPARQESVVLAWNVGDAATGRVQRLVEFTPTGDQFYIFQFFDQFGQSHNVWSPDSSQIVYAELLPDDREVVSVVDVASGESTVLVAGSLGVFSFE